MIGRQLAPGAARGTALVLAEPLSLWGGMDPATGLVSEPRHPQAGASLAGRVVVMSSARGSSSSASVLAEAIRAGTAPAAIVMGEVDLILALGAAVGEELYGVQVPIVVLAPDELGADHRRRSRRHRFGRHGHGLDSPSDHPTEERQTDGCLGRPGGRGSRDLAGDPGRGASGSLQPGADRLRELSEPGGAGGHRIGAHRQVRRGLPGAPLLRRLRGRRPGGEPGPRPGARAVRGGARERPAPRRGAGQHGGLPRPPRAGRHGPGPGPGPGRAPDPRLAGELQRPVLQLRSVPRGPRDPPDRHGGGPRPGSRAPPQDDRHRGHRLPPALGLRRLPGDRRRGGRAAHDRHVPLRGPGGRRRPPQPRAPRGRGDDHHPQDASRPARGDDPVPRGARQGHRPGRLPRHPGRAADARRSPPRRSPSTRP